MFLMRRLNYQENTWDYTGNVNVAIEQTYYFDLTLQQRQALSEIGFGEDSHDCCLSHYETYFWGDFAGDDYAGVREALESLGYDENIWNNNLPTAIDEAFWDDLSPKQQSVAREHLCYTKELWDEVAMTDWNVDTEMPGSFEKISETGSNDISDSTDV